jgi:hypothetical protein
MHSRTEEIMSAVKRMGANDEYNAFHMELTASKRLRSISVKREQMKWHRDSHLLGLLHNWYFT